MQIDEALRDRPTLEARLERDANMLAESSGLDGDELDQLRAVLSDVSDNIRSVQIPTGIVANPAFYGIFANFVRDVEQAVARLGYNVPEQVAFGPLPTGQVNGLACAVPAGGLIVALDDGVFMFFNLLAKAVVTFYQQEATPDGGGYISFVDPDIVRAVSMSIEGNRRWLEAITATFVYGHPEAAPPWPFSPDKVHILAMLLTPAEMFIIAHEFAHLILGHYDRVRPTHQRRMLGGVNVDELETLREDELEADRLGLAILREHCRGTGLSVENTRYFIYFLHGCLNLLALNGLGGTPEQESTHPTPSERVQRMLQQLDEEEGVEEGPVPFSAYVYELMRHLYFYNLDRYVEWRELALLGTVPWSLASRYDWLEYIDDSA